ncbi:MAG: SH3 domain-containing protein, partial [Acidaminococcaceae bacterium]
MNTKIIDVLKDGESVRLGKQQMADGLSWTYTARKNGSTGWVATQYCKKTGEDMILSKGSRGIITGEDVRLRSEASLNADIMDLFTKGENVEILQSMNANERDWYKVKRSNGSEGWVASEYCRITK